MRNIFFYLRGSNLRRKKQLRNGHGAVAQPSSHRLNPNYLLASVLVAAAEACTGAAAALLTVAKAAYSPTASADMRYSCLTIKASISWPAFGPGVYRKKIKLGAGLDTEWPHQSWMSLTCVSLKSPQ
jgi:hypothetical protein